MNLARYASAYRWMGEPMGRFRFRDEDERDERADDFECHGCGVRLTTATLAVGKRFCGACRAARDGE
jgi:hypothetical protein